LLSGYALLPEEIRFSRGILVFGILMSFILMSVLRALLLRWNILTGEDEEQEQGQTIVVANEKDFAAVSTLMENAGMHERVLGRVSSTLSTDSGSAIGNIQDLNLLIKTYPVKEIVFCEDGLSFKDIITAIQHLPHTVRNKFHASGSNSIIGSDDKDMSGQYVAHNNRHIIGSPVNRRNKNLFDVLIALALLLSLPVHLLLQKKRGGFIKNLFDVLLRKKTWVGYAAGGAGLPAIKKGVLTSTSVPAAINKLPLESLQLSDEWYASSYSAAADFYTLMRGYKYLGYTS
jgi:hypothetical protein